jgi:hypothetical protein
VVPVLLVAVGSVAVESAGIAAICWNLNDAQAGDGTADGQSLDRVQAGDAGAIYRSADDAQMGDHDLDDVHGAVRLMNTSVVYLTMCPSDLVVGVLSMSVLLALRDSPGHQMLQEEQVAEAMAVLVLGVALERLSQR